MTDSWENQFTEQPPNNAGGWTMITCTHRYHGVKRFYVSADKWQDSIRSLLVPYWVNAFTIIIQPMDGV
jgi:hypothetical protein